MNELSLHILDICQNSIKANATLIEIEITETRKDNLFQIVIRDNGHGMNAKTLSEVADPFFTTRTTRKVGMGISLFKMAAEMTNGTFTITSDEGVGTTVTATFEHNHIDRAPLGAMEDTLSILLLNEEGIDITYTHQYNNKTFLLDTREIKQILEGTPLTEPSVIQWIKEHIQEGISHIQKEESQ